MHHEQKQNSTTKDAQHTERLYESGIQVLRFTNTQVLIEIEAVLQVIYEKVTPSP